MPYSNLHSPEVGQFRFSFNFLNLFPMSVLTPNNFGRRFLMTLEQVGPRAIFLAQV